MPYSKFEGTYAEYALLKEDWVALAPSPEAMPLAHAAGVPLVALTAMQALEKATPSPGQRILVLGASGGVGQVRSSAAPPPAGLPRPATSATTPEPPPLLPAPLPAAVRGAAGQAAVRVARHRRHLAAQRGAGAERAGGKTGWRES